MEMSLKEATAEKHRAAEKMPFNVRMFKGQLTKQQYLAYLHQQLGLFEALEKVELPHQSLNRTSALLVDIAELVKDGCEPVELFQSSRDYINYLLNLSQIQQLPHVYLHYLAVMFGGQMIKSQVPSKGAFYYFSEMPEGLMSIRNLQKDSWANEVNRGFDFTIAIFEELEAYCLNHP
jgi:heme oxygenase